jgi:hypothetical protein
MRLLKLVAFNALIALALLEVSLFAAARLSLVSMDLPSYTLANVTPFWGDTNKDFGVWHPASSQYRHTRSCFNVVYRSNAHGMRDDEAPLKALGRRVVVLGDSFVEGFGVDTENRVTELLEARTGIPHLNFGTSGSFGLTQSLILYKTLASRFEHTAVIIGVLPDNDFADDDWQNAQTAYRDRYRPYLVGSYPAYELRYSNPGVVAAGLRDTGLYAEQFLNEFSYTARAYSFLRTYLKAARAADPADKLKAKGGTRHSRFFEFNREEFDRMRYAVEQIVTLAAPRPVLVMSIPRRSDYTRVEREGRQAPLSQEMEALSRAVGFTYVDLLDRSPNYYALDELFFSCDPHWSPGGHAMAAAELAGWAYYRQPATQEPADETPVGTIPRLETNEAK